MLLKPIKLIVLLLLGCLCVGCQAGIDTARPLPTLDTGSFTQSAPDAVPPGVTQSINAIRRAAQDGDRQALLSWISEDIVTSYGTEDAHAIFLSLWEDPSRQPYHRFLRVFDRLTRHGGTRVEDDSYLFPYFAKIEDHDINTYYLVRVSSGIVQLAKDGGPPRSRVRTTDTLLCVDLSCLTHRQDGWLELRTRHTGTVYARSEDLVFVANEYRLRFDKEQDGKYRLGLLVTAN